MGHGGVWCGGCVRRMGEGGASLPKPSRAPQKIRVFLRVPGVQPVPKNPSWDPCRPPKNHSLGSTRSPKMFLGTLQASKKLISGVHPESKSVFWASLPGCPPKTLQDPKKIRGFWGFPG